VAKHRGASQKGLACEEKEVNRFIPMQGTTKCILNAVVVIGVVLWLLTVFGLFPPG
jgi:hypothetical protein